MDFHRDFGGNRVLEPKHVLPTSAWQLDNKREIEDFEMRLKVSLLHIEGTSFKQICLEANNNDERIKEKIMDIVIRRGKLHNPVTDTGGLIFGKIEEIGKNFNRKGDIEVGDEIICNASLTSIPLYIDKITSIDKVFGQIRLEGYVIIHCNIPIVEKPKDLPMNLALYALNESGTLYSISSAAVGKKKFLVVGNNLLTNLFFGMAIKKVASDDSQIICILDLKSESLLQGSSIDKLMTKVFSEVRVVDILKPLECVRELEEGLPFDLSVNCADIPGAETINILATRPGGTVVFANLINNYNIALYITESISKELDIRCADGYLESYDKFDMGLVREIAPYVKSAVEKPLEMDDDPSYPLGRRERLREVSGLRQTQLEDFVCESRGMADVVEQLLSVAKYDCNVLITGETGVGKETAANIIYKNSVRKMQPFIKVNCASITSDMIESEFFGWEEGAMGDKYAGERKGYFELADKGTIFLDDVGELSPDMQAKLLRLMQDGEFRRVGGSVPVKTNVRIISATANEPEVMVERDKFRRDLYYRLNVVRIHIPRLRDRQGDIPALTQHFLNKYGKRFGMKRTIDTDGLEYLKQCDWQGNIRELENVVQRLMITVSQEQITLIDVMKELHGDIFAEASLRVDSVEREGQVLDLGRMVNNFEKNILKMACEQYGSTRKAAKAVGISQTQLVRKKKKYNI